MATPTLNTTAWSGEHGQDLILAVMNELDVAKDVTVMTNIPYKITLPKVTPTDGARPYRVDEDFVSTMTVSDRVLEIKRGKKDFQIQPEVFRTTYLQMARNGVLDPNEIPYEAFLMMSELKGFLSEINDDVAWSGVYNSGGSTAAAICDGFGTLLAAATDNGVTATSTGAISSNNAGAKILLVYQALPVSLQNKPTIAYVSHTTFYDYLAWAQANLNINLNGTFNGPNKSPIYLMESRGLCEIRPCSWIPYANDRILITPKENMIMGVGFSDTEPAIETVPALSSLKCRINYFVGFQFADLGAIACNEQS